MRIHSLVVSAADPLVGFPVLQPLFDIRAPGAGLGGYNIEVRIGTYILHRRAIVSHTEMHGRHR